MGSGKYSFVFEGFDVLNQKEVILKILKHENFDKINREILTLELVQKKHSAIANLLDYGREGEDGPIILVFEKFGHISMKELVKSEIYYEKKHVKKMIRQVLEGLKAIHDTGLIHRDIKPGNIIVDIPSMDTRIIDFGLTEFHFPNKEHNVRIATKPFKPPEILVNYRKYHQSFDLWGVGNLLGCLVNRFSLSDHSFEKEPI